MAGAYYNENDPYAAQWLRNLIQAGHIAPGDVDDRSIVDVQPDDLRGYTQCHFFAGIGGWSLAARLAGWPDERPLWTGSCPCQPFSVAGKGEGKADERHLWPILFALVRAVRPAVLMGEQVAAAVGKDWLDGVHSDLEGIGYACGAAVVPACAVDAPHRRDRLWFVADANGERGVTGQSSAETARHGDTAVAAGRDALADAFRERRERWQGSEDRHVDHGPDAERRQGDGRPASRCEDGDFRPSTLADPDRDKRHWWSGPLQVGWNCIEGKTARGGRQQSAQWRTQPGLGLLAHGVPARVGKLRAYGNAIVPQVAAEVIAAYLDARAA